MTTRLPTFIPLHPPHSLVLPFHAPRSEKQMIPTAMSQESCRSLPDGSPRPSVWSLYLEERRVLDEREAERSKSQIDAVLIFAGLFSATVAAFIVESYKNLNVDPEDTTAVLLARISQQLSNASIPALPVSPPFEPTSNTVNVNVLWFTSLACSLTAALGAIILQQCTRDYRTRQLNYQRISQSSHHTQARIHAYLLRGAERWLLADAADYLGALIHSSLFLFLAGLVIFLSDINRIVYYVMLVVTVTVASFHFFLSLLPIVYPGFPYSTPFTKPLAALFKFSATAAIHAYVMPFLIASRVFDRDFTTRFAGPVDIVFKRVNTPLPIIVARKSNPWTRTSS
ncbi:hypothetical protein OF83DRAFT_716489 [Amylostereum chailletii]|nr:hypothetical protein OF83DRAFT_716489 [Amylostereum chailletii]